MWQYVYVNIIRMSSLSVVDYVNLCGHYSKLQSGPSIDPRLLERYQNQPERLEQLKKSIIAKGIKSTRTLNLDFKAPLEDFNYNPFSYVYTLFLQYKQGTLPFPGSTSEQPAQIIEIFNTLDSLEMETKERQMKEEQRKAKRKRK